MAINAPEHPGFEWIMNHMEDLPKNTWIAANKNGIVVQASNCTELHEMLGKKGIEPEGVCIHFNS